MYGRPVYFNAAYCLSGVRGTVCMADLYTLAPPAASVVYEVLYVWQTCVL